MGAEQWIIDIRLFCTDDNTWRTLSPEDGEVGSAGVFALVYPIRDSTWPLFESLDVRIIVEQTDVVTFDSISVVDHRAQFGAWNGTPTISTLFCYLFLIHRLPLF